MASGNDCVVSIDTTGIDKVQVGPQYDPSNIGSDNTPPIGLSLLLAMLDGRPWPIHVCGDQGIGANATPWGAVDNTISDYTAIDEGPIPGVFPADPPIYPGVGITAYGCQINCDYTIVGNLGADVIVAKIDEQWQILRVLGSASTIPLFGPSNDCRCCGNSLKSTKLRARIIKVSPESCGEYRACHEFDIDPVSTLSGGNPLGISIACNSAADSTFEDITDWVAYARGTTAEILTLNCCTEYAECSNWQSSASGSDDPSETCICDEGDIIFEPVSGSGSGSGSGAICRFEATIRIPATEEDPCSYDVLIYSLEIDACEEFEDVNEGEPVIMEACGLPALTAGTRVIMVRIPGGIPGREALDGEEPIEWFVVRACSSKDCANSCDQPPPEGPLCCGQYCSEMPQSVSVSIEMISGDLNCTGPVGVSLEKWGGGADECDGASDTRWRLTAPIPDNTLCPGVTTGPVEGADYPTWLDIESMELICGSGSELETCGGGGSGSGSGSGSGGEGPPMSLALGGGLETGDVFATQDLVASCCNPLYLEYTVTGMFGMVAGAGDVPAIVTLRIIITE
jgi:hypothetical protein